MSCVYMCVCTYVYVCTCVDARMLLACLYTWYFQGGGSDVTEALLVGVMLHEIFDLVRQK